MTVLRIVADLATPDVPGVQRFYAELFGLTPAMEFGWISTLTSGTTAPVQLSIASEGGSGAPVPHLSIEVDDVDTVHTRATQRGDIIAYPLTDESWGVRRFFVQDPSGRLVNVLTHQSAPA